MRRESLVLDVSGDNASESRVRDQGQGTLLTVPLDNDMMPITIVDRNVVEVGDEDFDRVLRDELYADTSVIDLQNSRSVLYLMLVRRRIETEDVSNASGCVELNPESQ